MKTESTSTELHLSPSGVSAATEPPTRVPMAPEILAPPFELVRTDPGAKNLALAA